MSMRWRPTPTTPTRCGGRSPSPGLQPRTAYGQAGANQFLGQLEAGWRVELGGAAGYFITPFALLQGSTATQNGFTETGAQSLNLMVTQQTSGSLRTIFGAQVGAAMDVGWRDRIAAQLRLGWSHEYADTARPVTASFAGAPAVPFTVFGAAPQRDGAVLGFSVSTAITVDGRLPPLRGQHRRAGLQPRADRRIAHDVVKTFVHAVRVLLDGQNGSVCVTFLSIFEGWRQRTWSPRPSLPGPPWRRI